MKIATWNVNGVRARQAELQEFIEKEHPDVLCLQEIKASVDQLPMWLCEIPGYSCYWHGAKGYSGVALHVRTASGAARPEFHHPAFDYESRIVLARLPEFTVASIYVPNGGKDFPAKMQFLVAMDEWALSFQGSGDVPPRALVLCGDLNVARTDMDVHAAECEAAGQRLVLCGDMNVALTDMDVHPKERKPGIIGQRPEERALMQRLISHGLVDVHRLMEPENPDVFTWWAPWRNMKQRNIGWRLDLILASRAIADRTVSCLVQREFGASDHGPVITVFDLTDSR